MVPLPARSVHLYCGYGTGSVTLPWAHLPAALSCGCPTPMQITYGAVLFKAHQARVGWGAAAWCWAGEEG